MSQQEEGCSHRNARITIYEITSTVYMVEGEELDLGGETLKPDPTGEVGVYCEECDDEWLFSSEDEIPDPWKSMVHRIFHEGS